MSRPGGIRPRVVRGAPSLAAECQKKPPNLPFGDAFRQHELQVLLLCETHIAPRNRLKFMP